MWQTLLQSGRKIMKRKKIVATFLLALPFFFTTTFFAMEKKVEDPEKDYSCLCNVLFTRHERKDSAVLGYLKAQEEFKKLNNEKKEENNTPHKTSTRTEHERKKSAIDKHNKLKQFLFQNEESVSARATSDKEELRRREIKNKD